MVLYLIGLGLGSPFDLSLRALSALHQCDRVFVEHYTAVFTRPHDLSLLQRLIDCTRRPHLHRPRRLLRRPREEEEGRRVEITLVDRETVEQRADAIFGWALNPTDDAEGGIEQEWLGGGDEEDEDEDDEENEESHHAGKSVSGCEGSTNDKVKGESEARERGVSRGTASGHAALLVVGDPLCATTHCDLMIRAHERDVNVIVIHNASIMSACAISGMQLYRFGQCVSIPYFEQSLRTRRNDIEDKMESKMEDSGDRITDSAFSSAEQRNEQIVFDIETELTPSSWLDKIEENLQYGLHTLCLLDIKVKEQTPENLAANKKIFEPSRFMSIKESCKQILALLHRRHTLKLLSAQSWGVGIARIGRRDQKICSGTLHDLSFIDFGSPLHSLVICAPLLHDVEKTMWRFYHFDNSKERTEMWRAEDESAASAKTAQLDEEARERRAAQAERMNQLNERKRKQQQAKEITHIRKLKEVESAAEDEDDIVQDFSPLI